MSDTKHEFKPGDRVSAPPLSERMVVRLEILCSIFQLSTLAGTAWLIGWKGWSPWWVLFWVFLAMGSSTGNIIKAIRRANA